MQHFDIRHHVVWAVDKIIQVTDIHLDDDGPDKKEKQQILQTAQRVIQPAGHPDVLSENEAMQSVQILGQQTKRAHPAAETAFEQNSGCQDDPKDNQSGRVDGIEDAGHQPVFKADQGADKQ